MPALPVTTASPIPRPTRRAHPPARAGRLLALAAAGLALLAACKRIDGIEPPAACVGEEVTLTGFGFGASQGTSTVTFDGTDAGAASAWSDAAVTVAVPAGAATGPVVMTTGSVPSPGVPFRVVECPAPGVVPTKPQIAVGPSGEPHVVFAQSGPTLHYVGRPQGDGPEVGAAWGPVEPVDNLQTVDFDVTVDSGGSPHVAYQAPDPSPDPPIASPTYHRVRSAGAWSAPIVACPGELMTSEFCGSLKLAVESDGLPILFSKDGDRYGNNWIKRKKFDGAAWPASTTIEYGSMLKNILAYDAIADHLDSWHLGIWRNHFELPLDTFRRIEHSAGGAKATLGQAASGADDFSVPSLADSANKVHIVWRDHASLLHRRFDLATQQWDAAATVFHTLAAPPGEGPFVTADPEGADGAFAIWTDGGTLYGAVYDGVGLAWGAPSLIARDVTLPDLATRAGTVHLVWRGATTNDLRYTTLP